MKHTDIWFLDRKWGGKYHGKNLHKDQRRAPTVPKAREKERKKSTLDETTHG